MDAHSELVSLKDIYEGGQLMMQLEQFRRILRLFLTSQVNEFA